MTTYFAQAAAHRKTGIPADDAVNTWCFQSNSMIPVEEQITAIFSAMGAFYNAIDLYLSPVLTGTGTMKIYDLADPEPRTPIAEQSGTFFSPTGQPIPEEIAVCLSFHGIYESGEPKARRRGRVYVGPLSANAFDATVDPDRTYVNPEMIEALHQAQSEMFDILSAENVLHCVWSRADNEFYDVTTYWVDNALDVQRRRGPAATSRTSWAWDVPPD